MKTNQARWMLAALTAASLACSGTAARAQVYSAANSPPAATLGTTGPRLGYGVSQILQLAQAKVPDDTILAFIRSSGNSYGLNADQIIFLRQQGLSDAVVTAMLSQPRAGVALTLPTTPAPPPVPSTAYAGPASTDSAYVQTVPDATYYSQPYYDYYPYSYYPYCYPAYGCYAPVLGWGWGWGGRGYYGGYGGFRGGFRGGGFSGGFRGGGFGGGGHVGGFGGSGHVGGFGGSGHVGGFGGGGHGGGRR
jgi:hypothetical protein